jgi:hypothetical protein
MFLIAAAIHILPVSGVLGADQLARLYGIVVADPNLAILMRHRAVLLCLFGAFWAAAAFIPSLQRAAFITGFVSTGSFLLIAWMTGDYNAQVQRVFTADLIAISCLVIGLAAYVYAHRTG